MNTLSETLLKGYTPAAMQSIIRYRIARTLGVNPRLNTEAELVANAKFRIEFIAKKVIEANANALVLGISGGVDSMLAGRLCRFAVNLLRKRGHEVKFIAMRLPYNTQSDAVDVEKALAFVEADLVLDMNMAAPVDAFINQMDAGTMTEEKLDFVKGNIKARARMIAQYAVANQYNGLVVGTDHAAEAVMGFFTKFGDGACDIAPLSGLVKRQVRQICQVMQGPEEIINKAPTADLEDLRPGKPDEEAYGCTYEEIDDFLLGNSVNFDVGQKIIGQYENTMHKRVLPYTPD